MALWFSDIYTITESFHLPAATTHASNYSVNVLLSIRFRCLRVGTRNNFVCSCNIATAIFRIFHIIFFFSFDNKRFFGYFSPQNARSNSLWRLDKRRRPNNFDWMSNAKIPIWLNTSKIKPYYLSIYLFWINICFWTKKIRAVAIISVTSDSTALHGKNCAMETAL